MVSTFSIEPSIIASIIARVFFSEIRLPVPFHPVFTRYTLALCSFALPINVLAYMVGCNVRNASPNAGEKEGTGSVIPRSVPASFDVKPERKWY